MIFNLNLRKLPNQYGEVSVMDLVDFLADRSPSCIHMLYCWVFIMQTCDIIYGPNREIWALKSYFMF